MARAGTQTRRLELLIGCPAPTVRTCYCLEVRVISRRALREFWERHTDVEQALRAWYSEAKAAAWQGPADVKARYPSASIVSNNRVVFNIKGNQYRLVTAIKYDQGIVFIRFVGTHAEYDQIDAESV